MCETKAANPCMRSSTVDSGRASSAGIRHSLNLRGLTACISLSSARPAQEVDEDKELTRSAIGQTAACGKLVASKAPSNPTALPYQVIERSHAEYVRAIRAGWYHAIQLDDGSHYFMDWLYTYCRKQQAR